MSSDGYRSLRPVDDRTIQTEAKSRTPCPDPMREATYSALEPLHSDDSGGAHCDETGDVVQFSAQMFYATEDDAKAVIDVLRIGDLLEPCSVSFTTEDGSAVAGDKYTQTSGKLSFAPGERLRTFEIPITEDNAFDTTLEFGIKLFDPANCILGTHMRESRVLILDNDIFPDNSLAAHIEDGSEEALQNIGMLLLWKYIVFTFRRVPNVWWKSLLRGLLDQLHNVYYMLVTLLRVYLVDHILNLEADEEKLLFGPGRKKNALMLGITFVVPSVFLVIMDYIQVSVLDVGVDVRKHLRVNLFRKSLNFSKQSLGHIHVSEITAAIKSEIPEVVDNGFLVVFAILKGAGKIVFVGYFICSRDMRNIGAILIFPVIIFVFMACRNRKQIRLASKASVGDAAIQEMLVRTFMSFHLITDYKVRSDVVTRYEHNVDKQKATVMELNIFNFWGEQLVPFLSSLLVSAYIFVGSVHVLHGDLTLGAFLATINVFRDLGERFEAIFENIRKATTIIEPLILLTKMLNAPTDFDERLRRFNMRREYMNNLLMKEEEKDGIASDRMSEYSELKSVTGGSVGYKAYQPFFDRVPIQLDKIEITHVNSLARVTASVAQGNLVLITGTHSSGKGTLVGLLTDNMEPRAGKVLCPSHLRSLHVSYHPEMITYMGLFENLTFGALEKDPDRVRDIFNRVVTGPDRDQNSWLTQELEQDMQRHRNRSDSHEIRITGAGGSLQWHERMSHNEMKRLNFARAFIYNPEVLVLHRPIDEADQPFADDILDVLRHFVDDRGLGLPTPPEVDLNRRRPRTVFFTGGEVRADELRRKADVTWRLGPNGVIIEHKGRKTFTHGSSFDRNRGAQNDLDSA